MWNRGRPSKEVVTNIATKIAATMMEEYSQRRFANSAFYHPLFPEIAEAVRNIKLGYWLKRKLLATIRTNLIVLGMPQNDADYMLGFIEIELVSKI